MKRYLGCVLALTSLACATVTSALFATPTPLPAPTFTFTPPPTFTPSPSPAPTATPLPTAFPTLTVAPTLTAQPAAEGVTAEMTRRHTRIFNDLWGTVNRHYVYDDYNGHDWNAIRQKYQPIVEAGQTDDEFYATMKEMIAELEDEHSGFETPEEARETDQAVAGENDYAGIGVLIASHPDKGYVSVIVTFRNSPAERAGLKPHDRILGVDGVSLLDAEGYLHTELIRGEPGTSLTLAVQSPGGPAREVALARAQITGAVPIDYWLVPDTRIAYILVPTFLDDTIPGQVEDALRLLSADGPLTGVSVDNRENDGGTTAAGERFLSLFTEGLVGHFRSRSNSRQMVVRPRDVAGSQTVPLVVLVGPDTASYGEIASGILKDQGRATIVGETTLGNVEVLYAYGFEDGSRAWIASETFDPIGSADDWERTGIVPDVMAPAEWDEISGMDDPGLRAAVAALQAAH